MQREKKILIFMAIILPSLLIPLSAQSIDLGNEDYNGLNLSSISGVSKYSVTQNVKYQVEINYTLTHNRITMQNYYYKVARLNDRQPNSTITQYCGPYQETSLEYNSITGWDTLLMGHLDKFNNTYDFFNVSLNNGESISLDQKYVVKLNEVTFDTILGSDIGTYDTSDEVFDLYCNNTEVYYERDDASLIAASNSIVDPSDNLIQKAQKISNWVSSYLNYDGTLPPAEKGALWAYNNQRGDCSEYSTLMITLLRIQGIPARKVTGFFISTEDNFRPTLGQQFTFTADSDGSSNFLGHAWVEYYIPEIGWIACEPQNPNMYKQIDYSRFNLNIGAWFFMPGATPPWNYASEFPYLASPVCADHDAYDSEYTFKITVLESNLLPDPLLGILIVVGVAAGLVIAVIVIVLVVKRKKRYNETY